MDVSVPRYESDNLLNSVDLFNTQQQQFPYAWAFSSTAEMGALSPSYPFPNQMYHFVQDAYLPSSGNNNSFEESAPQYAADGSRRMDFGMQLPDTAGSHQASQPEELAQQPAFPAQLSTPQHPAAGWTAPHNSNPSTPFNSGSLDLDSSVASGGPAGQVAMASSLNWQSHYAYQSNNVPNLYAEPHVQRQNSPPTSLQAAPVVVAAEAGQEGSGQYFGQSGMVEEMVRQSEAFHAYAVRRQSSLLRLDAHRAPNARRSRARRATGSRTKKLVDAKLINQCLVCGDCPSDRSSLVLLNCDHKYCHECLNRLVESGTANKASFPPTCCRGRLRRLDVDLVKQHLEDRVFGRYMKVLNEFSDQNPLYCARNSCSKYFEKARMKANERFHKCSQCETVTCIICKQDKVQHGGKDHGECQPFDSALEDEDRKLVKDKRWKHCPGCGTLIERTTGCDHVVCECGLDFCYRCGKKTGKDSDCRCLSRPPIDPAELEMRMEALRNWQFIGNTPFQPQQPQQQQQQQPMQEGIMAAAQAW